MSTGKLKAWGLIAMGRSAYVKAQIVVFAVLALAFVACFTIWPPEARNAPKATGAPARSTAGYGVELSGPAAK